MAAASAVIDVILVPKGYQQITSLSSAASLTVPTGAARALIQCDSVANKAVRWRDDGTSPTTSVGMLLDPGDSIFYTGTLSTFKVIEVAASAKLNVTYYE